jgi:methylglutaconyl-CoA hydratase
MDESIDRLAHTLAHSNPQAMAELKKIFWKGTDHWDVLLKERAAISGKLILSNFSKTAIEKFKSKT